MVGSGRSAVGEICLGYLSQGLVNPNSSRGPGVISFSLPSLLCSL